MTKQRHTRSSLWGEKRKQANPFYSARCVYTTVAAACAEMMGGWEWMKKGRGNRGQGGGNECGLGVSAFPSASLERQDSALQVTFPALRVCHLHSNAILVFLQYHWEQSSECAVCHRLQSPHCSFHEHHRAYTEMVQARVRVEASGNNLVVSCMQFEFSV